MFDIKNYCYEHGLGSDEQNDPSLFLTNGKNWSSWGKNPHMYMKSTQKGPTFQPWALSMAIRWALKGQVASYYRYINILWVWLQLLYKI